MFPKVQCIVAMCDRALRGSLPLEELYLEWPDDLKKSELGRLVFEDLEEGIQHFPGKLWSGQPDWEVWHTSEMFRRILIDYEVLKLSLDEGALKSIRDSLLRDDSVRLDKVPEAARSLAEGAREEKGPAHLAGNADEPSGDTVSRVIGMVVGGGAGAFFLVLLVTYARVPVEIILGFPGIGLALGIGAFSFRRSMPWGILAAVLGYVWTVFVLWLRAPGATGLVELALGLPLTIWGAQHAFLVVSIGYLVGAGWRKAPLKAAEDE